MRRSSIGTLCDLKNDPTNTTVLMSCLTCVQRVTRKDGFDDALIGANASAEEEQQANEDSAVTGIDVILNHKLVPTEYSKKDYIKHVKDYVKR